MNSFLQLYKNTLAGPSLWMVLLPVCFLFSCEDYLEVELPNSQLTGEAVFQDFSTAEAALTDIYALLRDQVLITGEANGVGSVTGYYADELVLYDASRTDLEVFYQNALLPTDNNIQRLWNDSYNIIYACNLVIERSQGSDGLSEEEKDQLEGEALFIRGLVHFYLFNLFGDIPYVRTTDYRQNRVVARMGREEVYPLLINDLERAKLLLSHDYLTTERVRPNSLAASGLLARVFLYNEQWQKAEEEASLVINTADLYPWQTDLGQVFKYNSPSTIWQLKPPSAGVNTWEAQNFIFLAAPPPTVALSESLVSSFEQGDQRRQQWIESVTGTNTYYYANKYQLNTNTASSEEYSIQLRLAEQYLIRAEANAYLGNLSASLEDINMLRTRAGLPMAEANSTDELLEVVFRERRWELFTEQGHRWFDLKRFGRATEVLAEVKPGWEDTDTLWPIPEEEFLLNSNLGSQNPGY